jgi:hypothetical protein
MELQFEKSGLDCLITAACEAKNVEQTQELRLPDAMPDIGKVLCCWGQVLLRGKEWRSGGMAASGGVMVWVMYMPEDGTEPQSLETWVPFQVRWDFPDTDRDGMMNVNFLLRCVDARSLSARKLLVRVGVSAMGQAMVPSAMELMKPTEVPRDVQLLRRSYPVNLPREAGEKPFELDEELSAPPMEKMLRYQLQPELIDQKIMAGKVVFRGAAALRVLYRDADGALKSWEGEIPFSQFTDLEGQYDDTASAVITPAVTGLELERTENGKLHLKAGLTGQYIVYDRPVIEVVEDAYSPSREVRVHRDQVSMPMVLDQRKETVRLEQNGPADGQVADVFFLSEHPTVHREGDGVAMELCGTFQMLVRDGDGVLRGETVKAQSTWQLPAHENSRICGISTPSGWGQGTGGRVWGDMNVTATTVAGQGIPMVTGLTLGDEAEPDPMRPSLILRRAGQEPLWELAKRCGSTVDAICDANDLTGEPESGRMLLIPVL